MLWNSLPQKTADVCVDAKAINELMEQEYAGVLHTMLSPLSEKVPESPPIWGL